jgi:hypothetical protein
MPANLRVFSLIPAGLVVETVIRDGDTIVVTARAVAWTAMCPLCSSPSRARPQPICSAGIGSPLLGASRLPSGRGAALFMQGSTLPEADIRRAA